MISEREMGPEPKSEAETINRLRAVIHGQGLSMSAMTKEINGLRAEIAALRVELANSFKSVKRERVPFVVDCEPEDTLT